MKSKWYNRLAALILSILGLCVIVVWFILAAVALPFEYVFLKRDEPYFYDTLDKIRNKIALSSNPIMKELSELHGWEPEPETK